MTDPFASNKLFIPAPGENLSENDKKFLRAILKNASKSVDAYEFVKAAIHVQLKSMGIDEWVYSDEPGDSYLWDVERINMRLNAIAAPTWRLKHWSGRAWEMQWVNFSKEEVAVANELAQEGLTAAAALSVDYNTMLGLGRVFENASPLSAEITEMRSGFSSMSSLLAAANY